MFWPGLTGVGDGGETIVFVTARLACGPTFVVTLALLLDGVGSETELETLALLVMLPLATGAVMETVSVGNELPLASGPGLVQVMVPPEGAPQVQPVPDALAALTPAGSVSTTVMTPLVGSGPRFETSIV